SGHWLADDVFEDRTALTQVGTELIGRHAVNEAVPVAVRADLMTGGVDLADQTGEVLGDPAEDEEGGVDLTAGQQLQQAARVGLDPAGILVPGVPLHLIL